MATTTPNAANAETPVTTKPPPASPAKSRARRRVAKMDKQLKALVRSTGEDVANAVDDVSVAMQRGFSFTRKQFARQFRRLRVERDGRDDGDGAETGGAGGKKSNRKRRKRGKRRAQRIWTRVHRGNRMGSSATVGGDLVTNHLGLCLQLAFTAQMSRAKEEEIVSGSVAHARENVTREVYAVESLALTEEERLPSFAYVVENPTEFAEARMLWGLDENSYVESFRVLGFRPKFAQVSVEDDIKCGKLVTDGPDAAMLGTTETSLRVIGKSVASGKSRSWFFCSEDGSFLVKTCNKSEKKTLLKMMPAYLEYVRRHSRTSMLPQFYGLYTIKFDRGKPLSFIVMNYWFASSKIIDKRFDLKGSTVGRFASSKELAKGTACVYKDNDFEDDDVARTKHAAEICEMLKMDADFLASQNVLDFSLVYGKYQASTDEEKLEARVCFEESEGANWKIKIDRGSRAGEESAEDAYQALAEFESASDTSSMDYEGEIVLLKKPSIFAPFMNDITRMNQLRVVNTEDGAIFCGIIDVLTPWSGWKWVENKVFSGTCCGRDISCQPPRRYADRFSEFMKQVFVKRDDEDAVALAKSNDGSTTAENI